MSKIGFFGPGSEFFSLSYRKPFNSSSDAKPWAEQIYLSSSQSLKSFLEQLFLTTSYPPLHYLHVFPTWSLQFGIWGISSHLLPTRSYLSLHYLHVSATWSLQFGIGSQPNGQTTIWGATMEIALAITKTDKNVFIEIFIKKLNLNR